MTVELPRWALADRVTLGLLAAAAAALETWVAREGLAPPGLAGLATAGPALWFWRQRRRRPLAVEFAPEGTRLRFAAGPATGCTLGRATRVLGPTIVLHWCSPVGSDSLWLTPADLPRSRRRALAARLIAGAGSAVR